MKRTPLRRQTPIAKRSAKGSRRQRLLIEAAAAHLAGKHAEVDRLIALSKGREAVRIGNMTFELPAGLSKMRRREFLYAAAQHVLERGEITIADAQKLLREREARLDRITRQVRDRPRTKYARRERDTPRMLWTKQQSCSTGLVINAELWSGPVPPGKCSGPIEAHHAGVRGLGQKAPDDTVIPLCSGHHRQLTDRAGAFAGWPRGAVKAWELAMIDWHRLVYADHLAAPFASNF